ncbi:Aste57867_12122 [Aphanomyces stellatus]|uniref:Aste57867_12122 protein n=1 Tax=Aphanomyces stellatus TaxID=120398 RepID=A0A485KUP7_9STRA|nr:hypothetical protein As57867_012077 [Aphanomyces stellatus]VFT88976.1 Aste57867_12122 [Aphanomyces stellatus]
MTAGDPPRDVDNPPPRPPPPMSVDPRVFECIVGTIGNKLELIVETQDAKFKQLEAALADYHRRVGVLQERVARLPARICRAMLHQARVERVSGDFEATMTRLTETVLAASSRSLAYDSTDDIMPLPDDENVVLDAPPCPRGKKLPKRLKLEPLPPHLDAVELGRDFIWSDGSTHRAPEDWPCPVGQCRTMWAYWYRGDARSQIGPYRLLAMEDIKTPKHRGRLYHLRKIMGVLTRIAIDRGLAASVAAIAAMSLSDCIVVFDRAFHVLQNQVPAIEAPSQSIYAVDAVLNKKRKREVDAVVTMSLSFEWADGTKHSIPEGWDMPQLDVREAWLRWFRGGGDPVGPHHTIRRVDLTTDAARQTHKWVETAMHELIAIALDNADEMVPRDGLAALEALGDDELLATFDRAYHTLLFENPKGNLAGVAKRQFAPNRVHTLSARRLGQRIHEFRKLPPAARPPSGAIPDDVEQHMRFFVCADGTPRRTPDRWVFPSTVACTDLWRLWLVGDRRVGIGPFRFLTASDVHTLEEMLMLASAQAFMGDLVLLATDNGIVTSVDELAALDETAAQAVLARTLEILFSPAHASGGLNLDTNDDGNVETTVGERAKAYRWLKVWQARHRQKVARERNQHKQTIDTHREAAVARSTGR